MNVRIFKFVGKYGAGLSFYDPANEEAQNLIKTSRINDPDWEDLGIHQMPQSLIDSLGGFGNDGCIYEWTSE